MFYVALLMLDYFNVVLFDTELFTVALLMIHYFDIAQLTLH